MKRLLLLGIMSAFSLCQAVYPVKGAILQTEILVIPSFQTSPQKVQPGSQVKLQAIVKNKGDMPNAPGTIEIRFALPEPLDQQPNSILFATEIAELPSIPAGEQLIINFSALHQWPSLFDYIRNDWAMREYEAMVEIDGSKEVTGTRAVSFSAYYYEGLSQEKSVRFPSADRVFN